MPKEEPFYNVLTKKQNIKKLNDVDMLSELPFYVELNIVKTAKAFKGYAKSYSIEIIKDKDENMNHLLAQLEASKPVIKDLFKDLLTEMKGFKHQIPMEVFVSKQKENGDEEFTTVYFNSTAETLFNLNKYGLSKSFQQVLYRIDHRDNEGSACTIEHKDGEYINISIYIRLSGSTYIELPHQLKSQKRTD